MGNLKDKVKEIFENHGILLDESDLENVGMAISDTLMMVAEDIEEREPHATVSINRYREASHHIDSAINDED